MPSKYLSTSIKNFQFFPKSSIYDDDARLRISEFNRHIATLYFIVRTKKARFLPKTFKVGEDYLFRGDIEVDGRTLPIQFNCVDMLFQSPEIQKHFTTQNEFIEYSMGAWKDPSHPHLTSSQKYAAMACVDVDQSTGNKILVKCPVKCSITKEHNGEMSLSPYQLINLANADYPAPLEILYIGKSNDDTWHRIYNHNKWGLIEEHRDETEELLVYFLEIDKSTIHNQNFNDLQMILRDESELSIEDATVATEAALINYFIKEKKFNDHHVGSDITKSDTIVNKVKSRGYTDLVVECKLEGSFGIIGTPSSGFSRKHVVHHKL
ncbi:hypothetical protein OL229_04870 [Neisseriaceae bacterium JH1-16]|nr:hypothetical protein [Neisseriaceae bacterium JH1-16]